VTILRTATTWLSVAWLLALVASAHAQGTAPTAREASSFLGGFLKETRVVYPLRVGAWEARGEHRYEEQELGASVRYAGAHKDRWIDLYFYPAGVLPETRLAEDIQSTLEGIRTTVGRPGGYSEIDIAPVTMRRFSVGRGKQKRSIKAGSTSMRLLRGDKAYSSAMVMLVMDLYYVKARFSAEESVLSRRQVQKQLDKFTAEVVRAITIRSTGECWMPPPIVQKSALVRDAPGQLIKTEKDGTLSAVAYADRVEALDATSPEAVVMQFLSMPLSGRHFPGCNAPEDMNPAVPADMRELRLEFNAPREGGRNQSTPLRMRRTEVS